MQKGLTPAQAMTRAAELFSANNFKDAQALCEGILRVDAGHFYALHLLGTIAVLESRWEDGVGYTSRAIAIDPRHAEVLCNRGAALRMLNRFEEALADYDRALAVMPRYASAWNNRGVALAALNRHREALESYERALEIDPGFARGRFNRAISRLTLGDFEGGLPDYELRWSGSELRTAPRTFAQPRWTGREDLRGKTILLHAEQGFGDTIQFCRYVPLVKERGAKVVIEVQAPLEALLARVAGVDQVIASGKSLPAFDFHSPFASLPLAFGTRVDSIPNDVPYFSALPERVDRWRERLGGTSGPRVGLAWSGSAILRNDRNRSMSLAMLASAVGNTGCSLVSLQKDVRDSDRGALEGSGIARFESEIGDFEDSAALASLMDVVVCVDTSVAHLAGALAKPVWLLLPFSPDWRWMLEREDTLWYPTARLFRQERIGDWEPVLHRVREELEARSWNRTR